MKTLFLTFLAIHFAMDYLFQFDWIAVRKAKGDFLPHFTVVLLVSALGLLPPLDAGVSLLLPALCFFGNALTHFGVDVLKYRLLSRRRVPDTWLLFFGDQVAHLLFLLLFSFILSSQEVYYKLYAWIFRILFLVAASSDGAEVFFYYTAPLLGIKKGWGSPSEYFSTCFRRWYEYFEGLLFLLLVWKKWYYLAIPEAAAKFLLLKRFAPEEAKLGVWGSLFRLCFTGVCFVLSYYLAV